MHTLQVSEAMQCIRDEVVNRSASRVGVFTGGGSFVSSGSESLIECSLRCIPWESFSTSAISSAPAPAPEEFEKARSWIRSYQPDVIIAIGGGSVIDLAKGSAFLARNAILLQQALSGSYTTNSDARFRFPVVAIPTTSGTGSEVTPFSTVWKKGQKYSIDDESLLPDASFLIPDLLRTQSDYLTKCTGVDALAQAIESYWSVRGTLASRGLARRSLGLLWPALSAMAEGAIPDFPRLSMGAHLAGRAIAISRTTSCHALSYPMTGRFGIMHGHAVAVTLGAMLEYLGGCKAGEAVCGLDDGEVLRRGDDIAKALGASTLQQGHEKLDQLMCSLGLTRSLVELGCGSDQAIRQILDEGFSPERMGNYPRSVSRSAAEDILRQLR